MKVGIVAGLPQNVLEKVGKISKNSYRKVAESGGEIYNKAFSLKPWANVGYKTKEEQLEALNRDLVSEENNWGFWAARMPQDVYDSIKSRL